MTPSTGGIMPIHAIDMVKMAHEEGKRKVIFNTNRLHAWLHVYPEPGDKDDMHCHNADQTFYVIEGECTMPSSRAILTISMTLTGIVPPESQFWRKPNRSIVEVSNSRAPE